MQRGSNLVKHAVCVLEPGGHNALRQEEGTEWLSWSAAMFHNVPVNTVFTLQIPEAKL